MAWSGMIQPEVSTTERTTGPNTSHAGKNSLFLFLMKRHPTGGSFIRPKKASFGSTFLDCLRLQYETLPDSKPEEKFVISDSRNVAVAVEVVGNARLEQRLKLGFLDASNLTLAASLIFSSSWT
jgi:hypothetical protein